MMNESNETGGLVGRVVFAKLFGFVEEADGELSNDPAHICTVRVNGDRALLARVRAECAEEGYEAELLDVSGFLVGRIICDGDVAWTCPRARPDTCPPNFAPGQIVVIERVDEYAFLGRDHHPEKSDEGKRARVEIVEYESDHRELDEGEEDVAILTCTVLGEERVLELVGHEVLIDEEAPNR